MSRSNTAGVAGAIRVSLPQVNDVVQAECATKYEELLLQQRELYDKLLVVGNGSENNVNSGSAAILSNHISMASMIQSSILVAKAHRNQEVTSAKPSLGTSTISNTLHSDHQTKSKYGNANDGDFVALESFWEHTLEQQHYDYDYHLHHWQDQQNDNLVETEGNHYVDGHTERNRNQVSNKLDRLPASILCTIAALEQCQISSGSSSSSNESQINSALSHSTTKVLYSIRSHESSYMQEVPHGESMTDDFFHDYPECIRQDRITTSSTSTESDLDGNAENLSHSCIRRRSTSDNSGHHEGTKTTSNQTNNNKNVVVIVDEDDNHKTSSSSPKRPKVSFTKAPRSISTDPSSMSWDAYNNQNSRRESSIVQDQYSQYHQSQHHKLKNNNQNHSNRTDDPRSTNIAMNRSNAFCTASELQSGINHDEEDESDDHSKEYGQFDYGNEYSGARPGTHNAHNSSNHSSPSRERVNTSKDSNNTSINPNQPNLSAGLKRKFQLPTLRNGNNTKAASSKKQHASSKSTVGDDAKSSSKQHGDGKDGGDSDNDELPEELKGCEKELVSKIENEIVYSGDDVKFSDIAGLDDAKQAVYEVVCWPMKRPDLFTGLRKVPNGLLLFGPPGTGKTLVGKAIAYESGATFFSISSSSLTSKWIGEGEKLVRTLFAVAAYREPAVVFIDEVDSLLTQRKSDENEASRRIKTEFLVQLDGTGTSGQGRVLIIGATNRPQELDDAARRRFVKRLYIPLPEQPDREVLLRTLLSKNSHSISHKEFTKLSHDTNGFSGADLRSLCTDAALGPIRQLGSKALEVRPQDVPPISYKHFRHSLRGMNPSVAQTDLDQYVEWNNTYGSKRTAVDYDEKSESDLDSQIE